MHNSSSKETSSKYKQIRRKFLAIYMRWEGTKSNELGPGDRTTTIVKPISTMSFFDNNSLTLSLSINMYVYLWVYLLRNIFTTTKKRVSRYYYSFFWLKQKSTIDSRLIFFVLLNLPPFTEITNSAYAIEPILLRLDEFFHLFISL